MFAPHRNPATAYHRINVETGIETASPHKLTALLFEGALAAIASARGALQRGDIPAKGREIGRAARIVEEGLRGTLDREAGGELAANLDALYAYIGMRLTLANLNNDDAALQECATLIGPLAEAWNRIDPAREAA